MKKFIILFAFCFSVLFSFSQGWEKKYKIGPGPNYYGSINNIIPSKAGGYIASGILPADGLFGPDTNNLYFFKINDGGDTLWTKTYNIPGCAGSLSQQVVANSMVELTDTSILILGVQDYDSLGTYIAKDIKILLDKNGNELSYSIQPGLGYSYYYFMENSKVGGYYAGGLDTITTYLYADYPSIKKYDDNGTLLWQHINTNSATYGGSIQTMAVTSDSGIVVDYCYSSFSPTDYNHIYKLDKNGNLLWDKRFANTLRYIYSTSSNSTVMCYSWGYISTGINYYISEFNSNGDSTSGFHLGYQPLKIAENQYGGYTILGCVADGPSGYQRTFLVAYDSLWNTIWQQFDDNSYKIIVSGGFNWNPLLKTSDNGYLFGGYYYDFVSGYNPWIFRTDSLGNTYKNNISGRVSEDDNSDCVFNTIDHGYKNIIIEADNGASTYYNFTHTDGTYSIRLDSGNYSVTHTPKMYRSPICPSSALAANLTSGTDTINNLDFFDHLTSPFTNASIYCTPYTWAVPGHNYSVQLYYANSGTDTISGTISFTYDSILTFLSSSIVPNTSIGNTITWNYSNIPEDSMSYIVLNFKVDTTATLGDTLFCNGSITTIASDIDSTDNADQFGSIVVSSFDPNEKSVEPKGTGPQGYIVGDENLEYTVRFQNTGTYQAQNIVVRDTVSDNLDFTSFQFLSSSSPCIVSVVNQRTLYFTFLNINLPDSTSNESGSHGFLKYSIKPNAGLAPGTKFRNTAFIYFDYNSPIVTNTTLNTIQFPVGIEEQSSTNKAVKVYPNPFSDNTTFVIESENINEQYSFEMTNVLGKKIKSISGITKKEFQISRNGLENGIYFYKIYSSESVIGIGKLVIK